MKSHSRSIHVNFNHNQSLFSWNLKARILIGISLAYWIRNRDLTCVTTSSKPNNDGIWEIVSEISWTVWVPRSWTATVYDFLDKQSAACGWSPIVLHHPQEIWSRNPIPTSRNFSGHTKRSPRMYTHGQEKKILKSIWWTKQFSIPDFAWRSQ